MVMYPHWEEAEEAEAEAEAEVEEAKEKIRLEQYVSLRSNGRHNNNIFLQTLIIINLKE
jgi:hypothetical protein